jgi:hypothetical protein
MTIVVIVVIDLISILHIHLFQQPVFGKGFKPNQNLLALTNNRPVIRFKVSVLDSPDFSNLAYWHSQEDPD